MSVSNFFRRVRNHLDEEDRIQHLLKTEGPILVQRLCRDNSLRSLARSTGFSPTYLSEVSTGKKVISKKAYVELAWQITTPQP